MTRAELRTMIQAFGFDSVQATSTAAQNAALQATYMELVGEREWSWRYVSDVSSITAGNITVSPAVTFLDVDRVYIHETANTANRFVLEELPFDEFQQMLHEQSVEPNNTPMYWTYDDRPGSTRVTIFPRADKTYSVTVWGTRAVAAADFDADGESPAFDEQYHPVLAWGAIRILAFRQRDWNAYNAATTKYEEYKRALVRAEGSSRPTRVGHWDGWIYVK